jgi:hypothetical protein
MSHPDDGRIALYAGGDAGWIERISIARHMAGCVACRGRVDAYRLDRKALRKLAGELPEGLEWDRLAGEMTANIRVGLEAGECVGDVETERPVPAKPVWLAWRPALAGASLAVLLLGGWYLNFPAEQRSSFARGVGNLLHRPPAAEAGVSLEATRNGIQVSENGSAMTMMSPGSEAPVVVVSARGGLRANYVDNDTGQVTITNVYAQ